MTPEEAIESELKALVEEAAVLEAKLAPINARRKQLADAFAVLARNRVGAENVVVHAPTVASGPAPRAAEMSPQFSLLTSALSEFGDGAHFGELRSRYEAARGAQVSDNAMRSLLSRMKSAGHIGGGNDWWFLLSKDETSPDDISDLIGDVSAPSSQEGGDGHGPATT